MLKTKYRLLCEQESTIPIFSQAWWLDAVCGENNWEVCLIEKNNKIVASMPYFIEKRHGFKIIEHPPLTQTLGPWLKDKKKGGMGKELGNEKKLMNALIEQLPKFDKFYQNWHFNYKNWLPFFWHGYEQTTCYTYQINNLSNIENIFDNFHGNIKREIKKARDREYITIDDSASLDKFLKLNSLVFQRQNLTVPYSSKLVQAIDNAAARRKQRKIFIARDKHGRNHAGLYLIWDNESAYYLMGGGDPELSNSGARSLCMWEAIKFASTVTKSFNFEGSMIEPIEHSFRKFGTIQTSYFKISKINSKLLKILQAVRVVIK